MSSAIADAVTGWCEELWTTSFAVAGRWARRSCQPWSSAGGQRVWVIAPHPDDEAIGCAGTLLRHLERGDRVCVVFVTDGRGSRALGLGPEEMAGRRRDEADASLRCLGIEHHEWLGLREGDWPIDQLHAQLSALLERFAPDIIYAPSRVDYHPEHQRVAHGVAGVLAVARIAPTVRVYQIHVPLTSTLVNLWTDVSSVRESADAARRAYVTQADSVGRTRRMRRYAGAYHRAVGEAEEFWEMSAPSYCERHGDDPRDWEPAVRGVRSRAFGDPIAYWRGRAERRRLNSRSSERFEKRD